MRTAAATRLVEGWTRGFGPAATAVLSVLAAGYGGALAVQDALYRHGVRRPRWPGCPVVSVGNLTVGGTGKTPAVELAVRTLLDLGARPAVVSRGHRRQGGGIQVVADTASIRLEARDAGDEPFLLARRLPRVPVIVGRDRYAAACLARERFAATVVVLDDGLQHRSIARDLEVVMVRARRPWGNGRLFPRGPLREPLPALGRADLLVATGEDDGLAEVRAAAALHAPRAPLLRARHVAVECFEAHRLEPRPLDTLAGAPLVAFAGIAWPPGFESTLRGLGVNIVDNVEFQDHHWYTRSDLAGLDSRAASAGAEGLVTTEKDWVRLHALPLPACPVFVVSVCLALVDGEDVWRQALEAACR